MYVSGPAFTVDESMIKFKGRLAIWQYMPIKPIKWGVKVWTMAVSTTECVCNFQIYTGREAQMTEQSPSHRVIMNMCRMLQGNQAEVYFDTFFGSVCLMKDPKLLLNTQACGTVLANRRDLSADAVPKKGRPLKCHETKVAQRDELVFAHWQDTKPVCILSNFHDPVATRTV